MPFIQLWMLITSYQTLKSMHSVARTQLSSLASFTPSTDFKLTTKLQTPVNLVQRVKVNHWAWLCKHCRLDKWVVAMVTYVAVACYCLKQLCFWLAYFDYAIAPCEVAFKYLEALGVVLDYWSGDWASSWLLMDMGLDILMNRLSL